MASQYTGPQTSSEDDGPPVKAHGRERETIDAERVYVDWRRFTGHDRRDAVSR